MSAKFIVVLLFIAITALTVVPSYSTSSIFTEELNDEWESFKLTYQKSYSKFNEVSRRLIWEDNLKYIQQHNIMYDLGKKSYFLGVNQFADWTDEEYKNMLHKFDLEGFWKNYTGKEMFIESLNQQLPTTVNWVTRGYVTPVKNQGRCGSCWSFSTTGSMEGQYKRKHGRLVSFSEQQLVDCSFPFGNHGCHGGLMNNAFRYIMRYGLELERSYPYYARVGACKYRPSLMVGHCFGFVNIPRGNEQQLMAAVSQIGPISVAIDASRRSFRLYKGGVYNERACSSVALDHAVLVAGYGNLNGRPYWLVKNSWGPVWGRSGYILMSKDRNNQCGIASMASYPRV